MGTGPALVIACAQKSVEGFEVDFTAFQVNIYY